MTRPETFDAAIEASHQALDEIARGNPDPFFELYSDREDATLANPYGPPACGRHEIEQAGQRAASNYRDGKAVEFQNFAKFETADLGYMLESNASRRKSRAGRKLFRLRCVSRASFGLRKVDGNFCIVTLTQ
jgi:ketosteroid isomerase-like protein